MKVAILGTENSHALAFAKIFKNDPRYADVEIIGLYGPDDANQKIIDGGYASYAAKSPDEFVDKVDAIIVTARHGDHHYDYAMPYLKAGISAFIDKPFAVSLEKAEEMIATAKASGAKLCGGSGIKFLEELIPLKRAVKEMNVIGGMLAAPVSMVNEYGGFYFYSSPYRHAHHRFRIRCKIGYRNRFGAREESCKCRLQIRELRRSGKLLIDPRLQRCCTCR